MVPSFISIICDRSYCWAIYKNETMFFYLTQSCVRRNVVLQNEVTDEELEHFEDIVEETDIQESKTADKQDSKGVDDNDNDDPSEDEASPSSDDEYFSDEGDDDLLSFGGLTNLQELERTSIQATSQSRGKYANSSLPGGYDPRHREPIYRYFVYFNIEI